MLMNHTLPKELEGLLLLSGHRCPKADCMKHECHRTYCTGCSHYWCDRTFPQHPCVWFSSVDDPTVFDVWEMVQAALIKLGLGAEDSEVTKEVQQLIEVFRRKRGAVQ